MAYSEAIDKLKQMLDGYSAESGRLEELYKTAVKNAEEGYKNSLQQLNDSHYRERNEAYADIARDERNTMNMLASRGLGYSGEAAQAKLNSNVLLENRLGEIGRSKAEAEISLKESLDKEKQSLAKENSERLSSLEREKAGIYTDIAKLEQERELEQAKINAEKEMHKAELEAKYGENKTENSGTNGEGGENSSNGEETLPAGFNPEATPKELAKLLVGSATDDGYIRSDYDEYLINRYMLELYENYTLPEGYIDELVFMLKAYGYPESDISDMRIQVISRDAKSYYDERYKARYDSAILSGNHALSATAYASQTARDDLLSYIHSRCKTEREFIECCVSAGLPKSEAEGYIKTNPITDNNPTHSSPVIKGGRPNRLATLK